MCYKFNDRVLLVLLGCPRQIDFADLLDCNALMSNFGGKHCAKCKMEVKDLTNQRVDSSKMLTATFRPF